MSYQTRLNINATLASANGFDQTFKNGAYPNVVYSPSIKWLMSDEVSLHWLVSDLLIIAGWKARQFREIQEDWHTEARFINEEKAYLDDDKNECMSTGRMEYVGADPMTGDSKIIYTQYYDSHDCNENLNFYIRDHIDGGKPCKLVMVSQED